MRKLVFQTAAVMALASSAQLLAAQTQAQSQTCLSRPEMRGLVAYFLPVVLESTIDKCTSRLAKDSYMLARAPQLLGTLDAGRSEAWPMAKAAFVKIGGDGDKNTSNLFASLPEEAVRPLIEAVIADKISSEIKPESCGDIDRIMAPLEPLPAANLVDVVAETLAVAGRGDKRMRLCQDS
jgi:hypothetical protein